MRICGEQLGRKSLHGKYTRELTFENLQQLQEGGGRGGYSEVEEETMRKHTRALTFENLQQLQVAGGGDYAQVEEETMRKHTRALTFEKSWPLL